MPGSVLVGRAAQLRSVDNALAVTLSGRASLVLVRGPAGSGKTALIDAAHARITRAAPHVVVRRAGADVEEQIVEYGVVSQLHDGTVPPDSAPHEIAAEMLSRLSVLTRERPVTVVIDDSHWCDHSSRRVLRYLLRRISDLPVLVIVGYRPDAAWADVFHRVGDHLTTERIDLGGLDVDGVRALMRARGVPVSMRAAQRLHRHTGGNPQLLTVVAEGLSADELAAGDGPLPVPRAFEDWVLDVFRACDPTVRAVVAASAALGMPESLPVVSSVAGVARVAQAVDAAVEMRLLRQVGRDGDRLVDVDHALVRSSVLRALGFEEFHALHGRAAEVVGEPVRAMSHRLRAAQGFDPELAASGIALARQQAEVGAHLAAARLLELAAEVLPSGPARIDAYLRAAAELLGIGELRWAERLLDAVAAEREGEPSPDELLLAGSLLFLKRDPAARSTLELVLRLADGDSGPRLRRAAASAAELLAFIALETPDPRGAVEWASQALALADSASAVLDCASMVLASAAGLLGDLAPARTLVEPRVLGQPETLRNADPRLGQALIDMWSGNFVDADAALGRLRMQSESASAAIHSTVSLATTELDYRLGRWDDVLATVEADFAFVDGGWNCRWAPMGLAVGAYVRSARGEASEAGVLLGQAESLLEGQESFAGAMMVALARAQAALARADAAGVVEVLEPLVPPETEFVSLEGVFGLRVELVEALVAVGRLDDAASLLRIDGAQNRDPHSLAALARVRGQLACAEGDSAGAEEWFEASLSLAGEVAPFVRARTAAAFGSMLRRQGLRRRARELLEDAVAGFEALGATPFADRAREELSRCASRRGAAGAVELTPAESSVADLVVLGRTNREVANELSISIKTVETHLGRVFAKLGVRNRAALVAHLMAR